MSLAVNFSFDFSWKRTNRKNPCAICGRHGYCEISSDGTKAHCMFTPSSHPMQSRMGGYLHDLGISKQSVTVADILPVITPLPIEVKNQINRAILALFPLTAEHKEFLEAEGVNPDLCGSFIRANAREVARVILTQFGELVCRRHPALVYFDQQKNKYWTINAWDNGILFPAINQQTGLIAGLQLRKDKPKGHADRYSWLSRSVRDVSLGGTPITVFSANEQSQGNDHLIITEGYKKANVAARVFDCHTISIAGVNAYDFSELVTAIDRSGARLISIAFDQDKREKVEVQKAENKLIKSLVAARPELQIFTLNWPVESGKGLDDAIKAGFTEFTYEKAVIRTDKLAIPQKSFFDNDLPIEAYQNAFGTPGPLYTLQEARSKHRELLDSLIRQPKSGRSYAITSITGTGKSQATDDAIAHAALEGLLSKDHRVVILAPNKQNIEERTGPGTALYQAIQKGLIAKQLGRNPIDLADSKAKRTGFDCANPKAQDAGMNRHNAARVVCSDCPFGSDENWQKAGNSGARIWKCEQEGYLHSRRQSEKALAVIATKESYLNNSDEQLRQFSQVVIDEDLLSYLIEKISISSPILTGWREKIAHKNLFAQDWLSLFQVIDTALNLLAEDNAEKKGLEGRLFPVSDVLNLAANELGVDFKDLVRACANIDKYRVYEDTYAFETAYKHNNQLILPYRAAKELLKALEGDQPIYAEAYNGSFSLAIYSLRSHLVDILDNQTMVILDATLPPQLESLFSEIEQVKFDVPQNIEIVQLTNSLYSKRELQNEATRQTVEKVIANHFEGAKRPLAIIPLAFENGPRKMQLPAEAAVEHWGRHKATNQYSDCDALVLIGHHQRPVDIIKAEIECIYQYINRKAFEPFDQEGQPELKVRLYNCEPKRGKAAGRWVLANKNSWLQEAIEADYVAGIIQAVGRLRGAIRSSELEPARVLIMCNEPVADLRIDKLTTAQELLKASKISNSAPAAAEVITDNEKERTYPPKIDSCINNNIIQLHKNEGYVTALDTSIGEVAPAKESPQGSSDGENKVSDTFLRITRPHLFPDMVRTDLVQPAPIPTPSNNEPNWCENYKKLIETRVTPESVSRMLDKALLFTLLNNQEKQFLKQVAASRIAELEPFAVAI